MSEYIVDSAWLREYENNIADWLGRDLEYDEAHNPMPPISAKNEIVRCKNCVHSIKADLSGNWYECMKPDGNGDYARWDVEPDGFCAWASRRES